MLKYLLRSTLLILCILPFQLQGQITDLSFEFQAYPTGLIPGIQIERGFADKNTIHLRVGYQYIRHRDLGVHEDERGNGFGFTLGYKRYLKENFQGWFLGVRNDIWFNELDWKDNIDLPNEISGTSNITVVQPTAEAGYLFKLGENGFLVPTIAFGVEINVRTEGADVGEGAILLLGFEIGQRF